MAITRAVKTVENDKLCSHTFQRVRICESLKPSSRVTIRGTSKTITCKADEGRLEASVTRLYNFTSVQPRSEYKVCLTATYCDATSLDDRVLQLSGQVVVLAKLFAAALLPLLGLHVFESDSTKTE